MEFPFLIFPIYIQKIILVGSWERVTRSGMRNENEEWRVRMEDEDRGMRNGERAQSKGK